ncbi:MAG: hypothetical protein IEMM0002_1481 [bacterium]|nr:MAG: hypothetical protein IEMM0002_1481 [bacterium]
MKAFYISLIAVFSFSCQDHHFIPIEEADHIKMQSPQTEQPTPEPDVLSRQSDRESKIKAQENALITEGKIYLGDEQKRRDFGGFIVYVIAWSVDKPGFPVAVSRYGSAKFPISFRLDGKNLMAADFPAHNKKLRIEARLDRDGDPITKEMGDVFGFAERVVNPGTEGILITLNKNR